MNKEFLELSITEIVSITAGIISGSLLAVLKDKLFIIPGIIILIPGFLEMRGSIFGTLAARISTGLNLGTIDKNKKLSRPLMENILASLLLSLMASFILGLLSYIAIKIFFNANFPLIILISVLAAIISTVILLPSTIVATFWLYNHNYDPSNIIGPYVTTTGDIVSIISLLLAVLIV